MVREGAQPPEIETHLVNTVLTNGARYYVDHAHPEYSTPECADALELVVADKAGERILARSMQAARRLLEPGQEIVVYKNNSDGKGNSYGTHENYLVDRAVPFASLVRHLLPWFVSRQVFTGAGKVGSENGAAPVDYQISQRADFFEEEVGLETTLKRPIVNTRDEPHADPQLYRRLHVIAGDANLCEVATFLKVGTTAIVLAMIEDDFIDPKDLSIVGPVPAMRTVSHDPTCRATVELADGGAHDRGRAAVGVPAPRAEVRRRDRPRRCAAATTSAPGARALGARARCARARPVDARRPARLGHEALAARARTPSATGSSGATRSSSLLDLQYHDVRPERSLYERLVRAGKVERLVDRGRGHGRHDRAPGVDRAYFRGGCLARWPDAVVAANWDSVILDVGADPLRRIPMMEPLRGTKAHVEPLFDSRHDPGRAGRPARVVAPEAPTPEEVDPHHARAAAQAAAAPKERVEEEVDGHAAPAEHGEKLKGELDDLLDEIDEVLEENAEEFVKSYVQKGANEHVPPFCTGLSVTPRPYRLGVEKRLLGLRSVEADRGLLQGDRHPRWTSRRLQELQPCAQSQLVPANRDARSPGPRLAGREPRSSPCDAQKRNVERRADIREATCCAVRHHAGRVRGDSGEAGRWVRDLRRRTAAWHVDQSTTLDGTVRGILCFSCNGGLGQFKRATSSARGAGR